MISQFLNDLNHTTVLIRCDLENNGTSHGTGFFYEFMENPEGGRVTCIVTNKHVIENALRGHFTLTLRDEENKPIFGSHQNITIENIAELAIPHPGNVDLTAIPIIPLFKRLDHSKFYYKSLVKGVTANSDTFKSLPPIVDIMMIGYPIGLWDEKNNLPIIRRGISATHPARDYNGKPEFLIDCACFPGSSGSPVFLANLGGYLDAEGNFNTGARFSLLGILYAGPQFNARGIIERLNLPTEAPQKVISSIPINLGLVISSLELDVLESEVKKIVDKPSFSRNSYCRCGSGKKFKHCCGEL